MTEHRRFPPFAALLKSREVEDPVNLWVHRPLAYLFARLASRTSLTPNGITLIATLVGVVAGVCWLYGARWAMVAGGVALWLSAILDGADGMLARGKGMQSEDGRAVDGTADMVVAAVTVIPAFIHLYVQQGQLVHLALALPTCALGAFHIYLYDFYKESYLRMTRPGGSSEWEDAAQLERRRAELEREGGPLLNRVCANGALAVQRAQQQLVEITNPKALRAGRQLTVTEQATHIFRELNSGPMKLWAAISLAPHSYLLAICGMVDRLDIYMWIRLVPMNLVFVVVLLWQRRATEKTLHRLSDIDEAPLLEAPASLPSR